MDRVIGKGGALFGGRRRASSESSSSSSSSSDSHSLPSVSRLTSLYNSLSRNATQGPTHQPKKQDTTLEKKTQQSSYRTVIPKTESDRPGTIGSTSSGDRQLVAGSTSSGNRQLTVGSTSSGNHQMNIQPKINGERQRSAVDEEDEVFYSSNRYKNERTPQKATPSTGHRNILHRLTTSSDTSDGEVSPVIGRGKWRHLNGSGSSKLKLQKPDSPRSHSHDSTRARVESTDRSSVSSYAESPKHKLIFGVPLRRVDSISWGVKQKKLVSYNDESDSTGHDGSVPPSLFADTKEKFATFPKRNVAPNTESGLKASTLGRKVGGGGVKSKIVSQQTLGDRSDRKYSSYSDLTSADTTAASSWKRKSVSDDMYLGSHATLTRRQSISDLLKLYRTKSQSDLSQQSSEGQITASKSFYIQKDEMQSKTVSVLQTPMKMSDLKIVNPMTKPKIEPYKPSTKDIVRLPSNSLQMQPDKKLPPLVTKLIAGHKTSSDSESESESPPPKQRPASLYLPRPQHFHKPITTHKSLPVAKPVVTQPKPIVTQKTHQDSKEESMIKYTRMMTPRSYPGYSPTSDVSVTVAAVVRPSSSSSSSSDDEANRNSLAARMVTSLHDTKNAVKDKNPVTAIISSLNKHSGKPVYPEQKDVPKAKPQHRFWKSSDDDDADGIPHDDKTPSFIPLQEPKKVVTFTKPNVVKSPVVFFKKNDISVDKTVGHDKSSSDEADGIPHDDKVPSYIVTKPTQKPSIIKKTNISENNSVRQPSLVQKVKNLWPPVRKTRSSSSSSDSTVKEESSKHETRLQFTASVPEKFVVAKQTQENAIRSESSSSETTDDDKRKSGTKVIGIYVVNKETGVEEKVANDEFNYRYSRNISSDSSRDEREETRPLQTKEPPKVTTLPTRTSTTTLPTRTSTTTPSCSPTIDILPTWTPPSRTLTTAPSRTPTTAPSRTPTIDTKPLVIPKASARPSKLVVMKCESAPAIINVRPTVDQKKPLQRKSSSSGDDANTSKKPSRIPLFKRFSKKDSSSSDEVEPVSVKKTLTNNVSSSNIKVTIKRDGSLERPDSSEASGGSEPFQDFDPYAIGRMIVRGSRKSSSVVKKPEHLTNIRNATIPLHSPFSPLISPSDNKKPLEEKPKSVIKEQRQRSSSSSSSSDSNEEEKSLSFLNDPDDGVYTASPAVVQ